MKKDEAKKPPKPEKKPPEFKPDQIAEELKRDEAKKPRPSPKFDADQVAALLDNREPQRQLATAETLNGAASLGAPTAHAAQLSQSELDALRARLSQCWSPPAGVEQRPICTSCCTFCSSPTARWRASRKWSKVGVRCWDRHCGERQARAVAVPAVHDAQPEHYDQWKDIEFKFDPRELLGG